MLQTYKCAEFLQACAGQTGNLDTNLQEFAQGLVLHMYAKSAEKQVPVRQTVTFRSIINHVRHGIRAAASLLTRSP